MKKIIIHFSIFSILMGCNDLKEKSNSNSIKPNTTINEPEPKNQTEEKTNFDLISEFPKVKDSTDFINQLEDFGFNSNCEIPLKINLYKKIKIYGSNENFILIEMDYAFNNKKYQIAIFSENGKHIKTFYPFRYEFINLFPNESPVLMILEVTNQGNGGHAFYRFNNDKLESMNDLFTDYPNTFDRHQDCGVFEPEELKMTFKDLNNDGFKDILFNGTRVLIQYKTPQGDWLDRVTINGKSREYSIDQPFKKIPYKIILLYNKETSKFSPQEDYIKKYEDLY